MIRHQLSEAKLVVRTLPVNCPESREGGEHTAPPVLRPIHSQYIFEAMIHIHSICHIDVEGHEVREGAQRSQPPGRCVVPLRP